MTQNNQVAQPAASSPTVPELVEGITDAADRLKRATAAYGHLMRAINDPNVELPVMSWPTRLGQEAVEIHTDLNKMNPADRMAFLSPLANAHSTEMREMAMAANSQSSTLVQLIDAAAQQAQAPAQPVAPPAQG